MSPGLILYGAPATGKDTITSLLEKYDGFQYVGVRKLKVGTGRSDGYRMVSPELLDDYRHRGFLLNETRRYGNIYALDSPELDDLVSVGQIPIVHVGRMSDAMEIRTYDLDWFFILLLCPRELVAQRLMSRYESQVGERLAAWDECRDDICQNARTTFDLILNTDRITPTRAAEQIHALLTSRIHCRTQIPEAFCVV